MVYICCDICNQGEDSSMPVTSVPYSILESNPFTAACVARNPASNTSPAKEAAREPGSASKHHWSHTVVFEVSSTECEVGYCKLSDMSIC